MFFKYHYSAFDSYFSKNFCAQIIKLMDEKNLTQALVGKKKNMNLNIRDSYTSFLNEDWINKEIYFLVQQANKDIWNFNLSHAENVQFTKYQLNQYYHWHSDDNHISQNKDRKLSVVIALNDSKNYTGGDLLLKDMTTVSEHDVFKCDVLKNTGSVIIFPSLVLHKVTPITSGTRYSLVNWIVGDEFK
tara:strand:- start:2296 stop:2859 length:564 start_codon:yes stop_codon:yes gene_type:complete